jgi:hypothetical protein
MVGLPKNGQAVGHQEMIDLDQLSHLLAYHLPRMLSDLLGVDLRRAWPRGATRELKAYLRRLSSVIHDLEEDRGSPSPTEAAMRAGDLVAALAPPWMRIPKGMHLIDWLLKKQGKVLQGMSTHPVGRKYLRALNRVIDKYIEGGRREAAAVFLASSGQQEAAVVFQSLSRRVRERGFASSMRLLELKRPTMQDVPRLLELYATLAGIYEKLICRLLGLIAIQEGKEPDYDTLRRQGLGTNMARLAKCPDMALFVEGFNRPLRNAIAHEDVESVLTQRRLKFRDRGKEYSLSPTQRCRQVAETTALVMSLLLMDSLATYRRLAAFSHVLRTAKQQERRPCRTR